MAAYDPVHRFEVVLTVKLTVDFGKVIIQPFSLTPTAEVQRSVAHLFLGGYHAPS